MKRLILLVPLSLLLAGCSLSGDVTPPPGLTRPAEVQVTAVPSAQPPSAEPESQTPAGFSPPDAAPDLESGRSIYTEKCAPCHGAQGLGDGPMAGNLEVSIPALADAGFARDAVPADWYAVVTEGRMENFMPPFQSLSDEARWDVTVYALSLGTSAEELSLGQEVYSRTCTTCHGELGDAPGTGVDLADPSSAASRSLADTFALVSQGRGSMPPLADKLAEDEIWAVAAYVRTLAFPSTKLDASQVDQGEGQTVGTVTGTVFNGTSGERTPAGIEVLLVGFDGEQPVVSETALTDEAGAFNFEGLDLARGRLFGAIVEYEGVQYFSNAAHVMEGEAAIDLPVVVHERTDATDGLVVERLHVIYDFPVEGFMDVTQIWLLANQGDRTFMSDAADLEIQLPEGFDNLQASDTTGLAQVVAAPGGVQVAGPLRAGETSELAISFSLPYSRRAAVTQSVPLPVNGVTMITADDAPDLSGEGLMDQGLRDMGGPVFHSYELPGLEAGDQFEVKISGAHPAAESIDPSSLLIFGVGVLGLTMIGAGIYLWRTQRQEQGDERTAEDSPAADADRQALIQAIAELDDMFQSGGIPENEYRAKREALKQELKEILSQDDD